MRGPVSSFVICFCQARKNKADRVLRARNHLGPRRIIIAKQDLCQSLRITRGNTRPPQVNGSPARTGCHPAAFVELNGWLYRDRNNRPRIMFRDKWLVEPSPGEV